jgi:hypothetical protein
MSSGAAPTVDTPLFTLRSAGSEVRSSARLARPLGYSRPLLPFGGVSGRNHKEKYAGCIVSLATPTSSVFSASEPASSRNGAEKQKEESRRADSNRLPLLITSDRSCVAGVCRGLQMPHI